MCVGGWLAVRGRLGCADYDDDEKSTRIINY